MGNNAGNNEKSESCTLRTHKSALEFLRTISKYTPAKPEVKHAAMTAANPFKGSITCICLGAAAAALPTSSLCFGGVKLPPAVVCICTMPTPRARKKRAVHFVRVRLFLRRATEKAAVVNIFI